VELLPLIANNVNARDIAAELAEYVTDVDACTYIVYIY
jgi:hypothetical protein